MKKEIDLDKLDEVAGGCRKVCRCSNNGNNNNNNMMQMMMMTLLLGGGQGRSRRR